MLENLDFQNNGEVLQDFSLGTLGVLNSDDFPGLGVQQLLDLANTTDGDEIVGLDADPLQSIIGNVQGDSFNEFDSSVVGGIFAGPDYDQIGEFDHETMEAALEAAGANLLGGLGDFNAFSEGTPPSMNWPTWLASERHWSKMVPPSYKTECSTSSVATCLVPTRL